jgi:hypothetical protein
LLLGNQLDGDIAARGIRVRADFVGEYNEFFSGGFVYARDVPFPSFEGENTLADVAWSAGQTAWMALLPSFSRTI